MLPSLILNFFALLGRGLVWLRYKKEGLNACKTLDINMQPISSLFGFGLMIWILCAPFAVLGPFYGEFSIFSTLFAIGYPLVYILWFKFNQQKVQDLIAEAKAYIAQKEAEDAAIIKNIREKTGTYVPTVENANVDGWQCACGRVNAAYDMTCSCGITKIEMKLRKSSEENNK